MSSFKQPPSEELDHDFMWRYVRYLPERGRIGIFNRSYYEDVLVVRVHPEILKRQKKAFSTMHDTYKQDYLTQAERHIAIAEDRIARQKRILDELVQAGRRPIAPSRCFMLWRRACTPLNSITR